MSDASWFEQLPQVLKDWLPESASIAVADNRRYVAYRPGAHDLRIRPGDAVRPGSIAHRVLQRHARVESEVDASVFGIPYYGLGYPLTTADGRQSALTVILPPRQTAPQRPLRFVMGQDNYLWRPVPVEEITHFESYQKKTWFYTDTHEFTTNHTIQALEARLPVHQFVRIHRSFIVNIGYIDYIERGDRSHLQVILRNKSHTRLSVGRAYVKYLRESLEF
ncbi:LytR family transcriptional regulator [Alicyclobacillus contaminans]|uniref:LytTR family DNA-binding domain-containing protein n=1 Tax=Alicyclobacillus contaminans TaxID=392016 RepID=UPI000558EDAD|nr:LytTR family DNA-binding domain-containing protein [Alicyclobacillus contaminans]GMA50344.1 LytR family transcriptional regulator [Alicyclobacillus contaminans]